MRPRRSLDPMLAVGLTVLCELELFLERPVSGRTIVAALLLAGGGLSLFARRRAPVLAPLLCLGLTVLAVALPLGIDQLVTPQYVLILPPYLIGAEVSGRRALLGIAGLALVALALNAAAGQSATSRVFAVALLGGSFLIGRAVRSRRLLNERLASVALQIAEERERASRLAIEDIRVRISDDVNTLVARSVASMVVASEAAVRLLDIDHSEADAAMQAIEETGREALAEMRRVLGSIRKAEVQSG